MNLSLLLINLRRILRAVITSLWRKKWMAAFSVLILAFLFSFLHFSAFSRNFSDHFVANLQKKVDIAIFLRSDASESRVSAFRIFLEKEKERGEILGFWELSKEDALSEFAKKFPDETQFLENYNLENPLRDIFGVIPLSHSSSARNFQEKILTPEWSETIDIPTTRDKNEMTITRIENFLRITEFWNSVMSISALLFVAIVFVIVFHLTGLLVRSKSREISIMRLVGARLWFIRTPFILESFLLATLAFSLSLLFFWAGLDAVKVGFEALLQQLDVQESFVFEVFSDRTIFWNILVSSAVIGLFSSFLAAIIAVERALHRERLSDF